MKKKTMLSVVVLLMLCCLVGCSKAKLSKPTIDSVPSDIVSEPEDIGKGERIEMITIQIKDQQFIAQLEPSDTTTAFLELLPLTITMSDMNRNEKYYDMPQALPTNAQSVRSVQAGDIMLFGADCLVIFYEGFTTSYPYTRIARISDITGLKEALGNGRIALSIAL